MTTHVPHLEIPRPAVRTQLNADLLQHGIPTGFYDEHGTPAPRPDDIDEWRPATNETTTLAAGEPPF